MSIETLNGEHGIDGRVRFVEGKGGLVMAEVAAPTGSALISTYAGQVLSYKPSGDGEDLMFLADKAYFAPGKAIKGGVPVCWPWFGPDPEGKGRATHGFVRAWQWDVIATEARGDDTFIKLGLADSADTRAIWPHYFNLYLEITVGATLKLELVTRNAGDAPFSITQGFHTYFKVGDAARTRVRGLEDCRFIDKMDDDAELTQDGAIHITGGELNRIYEGVADDQLIDDPALDRVIRVHPTNSSTCVVWNPWAETAAKMGDLDDDDYQRFVCVETVNTASEVIEVPAQGEVRIGAEYGIEGT